MKFRRAAAVALTILMILGIAAQAFAAGLSDPRITVAADENGSVLEGAETFVSPGSSKETPVAEGATVIVGGTELTVTDGATVKYLEAEANDGYVFSKWVDNDGEKIGDGEYRIGTDKVFKAVFQQELLSFDVIFTAQQGIFAFTDEEGEAVVSPVSVVSGKDMAFKVVVSEGYENPTVKDGENELTPDADGIYRIYDIKEGHEVTAFAEENRTASLVNAADLRTGDKVIIVCPTVHFQSTDYYPALGSNGYGYIDPAPVEIIDSGDGTIARWTNEAVAVATVTVIAGAGGQKTYRFEAADGFLNCDGDQTQKLRFGGGYLFDEWIIDESETPSIYRVHIDGFERRIGYNKQTDNRFDLYRIHSTTGQDLDLSFFRLEKGDPTFGITVAADENGSVLEGTETFVSPGGSRMITVAEGATVIIDGAELTVTDGATVKYLEAEANDGYEFSKWVDKDGEEIEDGEHVIGADDVFKATFKEKPVWFDIVFTVGTAVSGFLDAQGDPIGSPVSVLYGEDISFKVIPVDPLAYRLIVMDGKNVLTPDDHGVYTISDVVEEHEIIAYCEANSFDVTFDGNGADNFTSETVSETYGAKYILPETTPGKTGYTFTGWYTERDSGSQTGGTRITEDTTVSVTEAQTLYARWETVMCTVTFDANGHGTAPESVRVQSGKTFTLPEGPTADRFSFAGWYKDAACTVLWDESMIVLADMTLYASYKIAAGSIGITEPTIGQRFDKAPAVSVPETALSGTNPVIWSYYDGSGFVPVAEDTVAGGRQYAVAILLEPTNGYAFADSVEINVNGNAAEAVISDGKLLVTYRFEKLPTHSCEGILADKEETCTEDGVKAHYECAFTGCGKWYRDEGCTDEITEAEKADYVIPAAHAWESGYTVDQEPTCTEEGRESIHCGRCDATKDGRAVKKTEHAWESGYTVDQEPTCTEEGRESIHCGRCDATKDGRAIRKKPHSESGWKSDADGHWTECANEGCGTVIKGKSAHEDKNNDQVCDVCGYRLPAPTPVKYTIIGGANSEWVRGGTPDPMFRSDAPFEKFTCVKVDGVTLDASSYTAESGSTRITLKPAYVKNLSIGRHTIEIAAVDGSASTSFTLLSDKPDIPKTGDNSGLYLWVMLLAISTVLLAKVVTGDGSD